MLWCASQIGGRKILLASIHTDSFNKPNNQRQAQQILEFLGGREAILAGDFNARPESSSMKLFRESNKFSGDFDGAFTFPSNLPDRRLDYILAPKEWELLEHRVLDNQVSDHCPIVSTFRVKAM